MSKDTTTLNEQAILQAIQNRANTWINEQDCVHISSMYAAMSQGKMLRSKLILAITAKHFSTHQQAIIDLCAIIELIQCASLLHDDVIDSATSRRNRPSINAQFGDKNAIMLGDVLYSNAFVKLCDFSPKIARCVAQSVSLLSKGEIEDVAYSKEFQPSLEIYYQILADKTASLISASAQAAALLVGLDDNAYKRYGHNLGMAFQIVDDILDITQDEQTLGKPAMNDIKEGKSTLPYILLYHKLDSSAKESFLRAFTRASDEDIAQIKQLLHTYSIITHAKQIANDFIHNALESIASEQNTALESIAKALIERTH